MTRQARPNYDSEATSLKAESNIQRSYRDSTKNAQADRSARKELETVEDLLARIWTNLIGRIGGPLTFRLIVQPAVATVFAIRAGFRDARERRAPYGWTVLTDPSNRREFLRDGWKDVATVFVAAMAIDLVYQIIELRWLYLEEALIVATVLALLPYLLLRGPANRIARHWRGAEEVL